MKLIVLVVIIGSACARSLNYAYDTPGTYGYALDLVSPPRVKPGISPVRCQQLGMDGCVQVADYAVAFWIKNKNVRLGMLIGATAGTASIGMDPLHQVSVDLGTGSYSVSNALNYPISLVLMQRLGQQIEFQFEFPAVSLPVGDAQSVYWSVNTDDKSVQGVFGAVM